VVFVFSNVDSAPALFVSRLLVTCCLIWAAHDDLYREHLRLTALGQDDRNNELLAARTRGA
jgi:hypothetical protein